MSEFRLVHMGFDKFDAAFKGAFPESLFSLLNAAKEDAQRFDEPHAVDLGPGAVPAFVHDKGMRGGFAWHISNGPLGVNVFVKENVIQDEWNIFIASRSEGLLAYGYRNYWDRNVATLKAMGAPILGESINRVDLALDFATSNFSLEPELFVAPPRMKKDSRMSEWHGTGDGFKPQFVMAGRDFESVTIGKMPGRQVIVYDKRAEALKKGKGYWFEHWGIDPQDRDIQVFRVELRAGKKHLKEDWGLSTMRDVEDSIGDVFDRMVKDIRYVASRDVGLNITRAPLHPLWRGVQDAVAKGLKDRRSGVQPGRIIEIERDQAARRFLDNITGNATCLAAVQGRSLDEAMASLPLDLADALRQRIDLDPVKFARQHARASARYRFINNDLT